MRTAEGGLAARLDQYEALLRSHNINFRPYDHTWRSSPSDQKLRDDSAAQMPESGTPTAIESDAIGLHDEDCGVEREDREM